MFGWLAKHNASRVSQFLVYHRIPRFPTLPPVDAVPSLHMDAINHASNLPTCNFGTGTFFSRWDLASVVNYRSSGEYNVPYYHLIADKSG